MAVVHSGWEFTQFMQVASLVSTLITVLLIFYGCCIVSVGSQIHANSWSEWSSLHRIQLAPRAWWWPSLHMVLLTCLLFELMSIRMASYGPCVGRQPFSIMRNQLNDSTTFIVISWMFFCNSCWTRLLWAAEWGWASSSSLQGNDEHTPCFLARDWTAFAHSLLPLVEQAMFIVHESVEYEVALNESLHCICNLNVNVVTSTYTWTCMVFTTCTVSLCSLKPK